MQRHSRFSGAIAVALLLSAAGAAVAQIPVWGVTYDRSGVRDGWDEAMAMAVTQDSCVVVTGFAQADTGINRNYDIYTAKYRQRDGSLVWDRTWSRLGGSASTEQPAALALDESGNIFITGWSFAASTGSDTDLVTLKYGADGSLAWASIYNYDAAGRGDAGAAIIPDHRGGAFVTGRSINSSNNHDIFTVHFSSAGDTLWAHRQNSWNGPDYGVALTLDPFGDLYVCGQAWRGSAGMDYYVLKFDTAATPAGGRVIWLPVRYYGGTSSSTSKDDYAMSILTDDAGNVYVSGSARELSTDYDVTTVKWTRDGDQVWVSRMDAGLLGEDRGYKMVWGPGGRLYCGGYTDDGSSYNILFFPIDEVGGVPTIPWFVSRDWLTLDDTLAALAVDAGGNLFVAGVGTEGDRGTYDWLLYKYGASGTQIWMADTGVFDYDDSPNAMVLDAAGDPYLAGVFTQPGSGYDNSNMMTIKYSEKDVGVIGVALPADSFRIGATIRPRVWVKSYCAATLYGIDVRLDVPGFWYRSAALDSIEAYDSVLVTFPPKTFEPSDVGTHLVAGYTLLSGDADRANDTVYSQLTVLPAWERLANIPTGARSKQVKDGAATAVHGDSLVFAFKGNNTLEFYKYNIGRDSWSAAETIPYQGRTVKKRVKAGSGLAADTGRYVYALKGNNSLDFWRYTVGGDSWRQLGDVPPGGGKKVKAGSDIVYVPWKNAVYAAKGANTFEFYMYDIAGGAWLPRAGVLPGASGRKVKDGSRMAYDGDSAIYLVKGGGLEFYRYAIAKDSWKQMPSIGYSINDPKRRKFKKGSGLAWDEANRRLLCLKGGKGTEFWSFIVARDSWTELPATDMYPVPPASKPPYYGTTFSASKGKVYSLKGNRTFEFWRYNADLPFNPTTLLPGPQAGGATAPAKLRLEVAPNPFSSRTTLSWALARPGYVRLALYDVTGRCVRVVVDEWQARGSHSIGLGSDGLSAGVYLASLVVRNEVVSTQSTRKLTVTR